MALELVTGYWGQEHVTADQDADLNAGVIGSDRYVLPIGEKMRAEAVTSNKIRIFDGVFAGYGRQCQIEEGAYVDVEIENGTAGLLRNDMIIVKYAKDETTGIEGVSFGVLKGQTGTTATDPVPNNQDIRTGAFESEMPLYRVKLNGLAIEAIQALYSVPKTLSELTTSLTQLNSKIGALEYGTQSFPGITETYVSGNSLSFNNKNLTPDNYPNSVFLVILNSSVSMGKATAYIVMLGTTPDSSGISLVRLDTNEDKVPILTKLQTGGAGVIWSGSATALIRANILKLNG